MDFMRMKEEHRTIFQLGKIKNELSGTFSSTNKISTANSELETKFQYRYSSS